MADDNKSKRRRLRPAPTVRERAKKEQAQAAKSKKQKLSRSRKVFSAAGRPFRPLGKVFHHQPFRFIGKVFKWIGRVLFPRYLRNSWRELRLVTWPTWKESRRLTYAVIIFAVVFGAFVAGLDYGLDKLFRQVILGK